MTEIKGQVFDTNYQDVLRINARYIIGMPTKEDLDNLAKDKIDMLFIFIGDLTHNVKNVLKTSKLIKRRILSHMAQRKNGPNLLFRTSITDVTPLINDSFNAAYIRAKEHTQTWVKQRG